MVAFAAAGAWVLVTRPDLVLPSTRDTSASTAGAGAALLRGLLALALGFAAAAVFFVVVLVVVVAFLGAAFLVVVVLAFYMTVSMSVVGLDDKRTVVVFLGAAFFSVFFSVLALVSVFLVVGAAAAGLASFFASFTVPEAPSRSVSHDHDA